MKLVPLNDRVILKRHAAETASAGGIIFAEKSRERPVFADVIAVGPGIPLRTGVSVPLEVKVGDKVLVHAFGGQDVSHDGETYCVMPESDIMAIVESA